ncbi:MAG: AAA family ATPase [Methylococcaceae bacterium]|jgi:cellulose biosynthesis protein BcsQ
MKVIALYSIKGGVGKTASAVNLAYAAANSGYKTLVWDLDPQGASSFYFRIKPKIKGGGKDLIAGKHDLDDLIKGTDFDNLDLLPADFSFRNLDLVLDHKKKPAAQLKKRLKTLSEHYDFIFLDCPPNISLLSEAVFEASDLLLSPIIPTTLSMRTLEQLKSFLADQGLKKQRLVLFFSMVDRRKKMHLEMMKTLAQNYPELLNTAIPYASEIERMGLERKPLAAFSAKSPVAKIYESLWQETLGQITSLK